MAKHCESSQAKTHCLANSRSPSSIRLEPSDNNVIATGFSWKYHVCHLHHQGSLFENVGETHWFRGSTLHLTHWNSNFRCFNVGQTQQTKMQNMEQSMRNAVYVALSCDMPLPCRDTYQPGCLFSENSMSSSPPKYPKWPNLNPEKWWLTLIHQCHLNGIFCWLNTFFDDSILICAG